MNQLMTKITAAVITLNEEKNIADCLKSVSWADEIVVLDSGSTDRTVEIAKDFTDKVFVEDWRGYGAQKNRAIELAQGLWILSIDADETVSPELAQEIRRVIEKPTASAYSVRRKNIYRGQWVRHGGWWPDWTTRLFQKGKARFAPSRVHESLTVDGPTAKLDGCLTHHSFASARDFLDRALKYSTLGALERFEKGKKATAWNAAFHAWFTFFKVYILRLGILDGAAGLLIAYSNAVGVFYRYMILREMCEVAKRSSDEKKEQSL